MIALAIEIYLATASPGDTWKKLITYPGLNNKLHLKVVRAAVTLTPYMNTPVLVKWSGLATVLRKPTNARDCHASLQTERELLIVVSNKLFQLLLSNISEFPIYIEAHGDCTHSLQPGTRYCHYNCLTNTKHKIIKCGALQTDCPEGHSNDTPSGGGYKKKTKDGNNL